MSFSKTGAEGEIGARPFELSRRARFLVARFAAAHAILSWAIVGGGLQRTRLVAFHEVKNAELPLGVDPAALLRERLAAEGLESAVGFVTSRRLETFVEAQAAFDDARADVVATVGLGNALRAGDPPGMGEGAGTINVLCCSSLPLAPGAALEALTLMAEARTLAVREAGVPSRRSGRPASGTGTDCLALAWPVDDSRPGLSYAGKHTAVGAAIGAAVEESVRRGVAAWIEERG